MQFDHFFDVNSFQNPQILKIENSIIMSIIFHYIVFREFGWSKNIEVYLRCFQFSVNEHFQNFSHFSIWILVWFDIGRK